MQNVLQVNLTAWTQTLSSHHFVSMIMRGALEIVELYIVYTVDNYQIIIVPLYVNALFSIGTLAIKSIA